MSTILGMKRKFEALNTDQIIETVMEDSKDMIADKNAEQLHTGIRNDGEHITPEYRNSDYAATKNRQNPLPGMGVPDLRLTGSFYRGIYVRVEGDSVVTGSTDQKAEKLEKKYGKGIYGLNVKFKSEVIREKVAPGIKQKIFDATGLIMKK